MVFPGGHRRAVVAVAVAVAAVPGVDATTAPHDRERGGPVVARRWRGVVFAIIGIGTVVAVLAVVAGRRRPDVAHYFGRDCSGMAAVVVAVVAAVVRPEGSAARGGATFHRVGGG